MTAAHPFDLTGMTTVVTGAARGIGRVVRGRRAGRKLPVGVAWLDPADVAPAVVYLASPAARMVTGTVLALTGGDKARGMA